MQLNPVFSIPLWSDLLNEIPDQVITDSITYLQQLCRQDQVGGGRTVSNRGASWQSRSKFPKDFVDTPLEDILEVILTRLKNCMIDLDSPRELEYQSIWYNINHETGYNIVHTHSGVLSGTFYFQTPNPPAPLRITREFDMVNHFYGSIDSRHRSPITNTVATLIPEPKLLVVFPSFMPHGVEKNESKEDRISLSFNTRLKPC
jgi:uncharacterized protein (TIGR02466 family)